MKKIAPLAANLRNLSVGDLSAVNGGMRPIGGACSCSCPLCPSSDVAGTDSKNKSTADMGSD